MMAWNWYGQPDFLIRSATAGVAVPILLAIGGAIFGVGYACLLMLIAHLSKRNIRSLVHLLTAAISAFSFAFASAVYALENREIISPFLVPEGAFATAGVAFLVACLTSVPHNAVPTAQ